MSSLNVARKFAWFLLVGLVAAGAACVIVPQCRHLRALQRRREELQEINRKTEELVRELRIRQERFRTEPEFVERTARETGRVKPNEIVYKFKK